MEGSLIFNTIKEYPNMIKISIYHEPIRVFNGYKRKRRKNPESSDSSIRRTRTALEDLCICNNFELFCTFTFDPKRYNSKSILFCRRYMTTWLHNIKNRGSKCLEYIVVPELHKSGAIHFHALLSGYNGRLKDSKHCQNGRRVYNLPNWHFGFSTAVKIDNREAVSKYIRKYITKDMLLFPGKKRYFCSQRLIRPVKRHNSPLEFLRDCKSDFFCNDIAEYYTINRFDLPTNLSDLRQLPLSGNVLL